MKLPHWLLLAFLPLLGCASEPRTADRGPDAEEAEVALETESVKPGINDNFLDPDLDVGDMVRRFEGESREVFAQRTRIARAVGLGPGDRVADIGAGTGLFTDMFARDVGSAGKVYAVDISPRFVEHLRQRAAQRGASQVEVVQCTERSAELPPGSVEAVFICDTYHHFEYPLHTMSSIHSALRDDGTLVIVDFERIPGVSRDWILDHVRCGKQKVIEEVASAGFEMVEEVAIEGLKENYFLRFRKR